MFQRWRREFIEFFFTKGNALSVAIAFIVGQQFTRIVDSITKDLLMPLLNPLVSSGSSKELKIAYFGGATEVGNLINTVIEALIGGLDSVPHRQSDETHGTTNPGRQQRGLNCHMVTTHTTLFSRCDGLIEHPAGMFNLCLTEPMEQRQT